MMRRDREKNTLAINKVPQEPKESFKTVVILAPKSVGFHRSSKENFKVIVILGNVTHVGVVQTHEFYAC